MPRVALHTLGCKLNVAETETIGRQFTDRGFEIVDFAEPADVYVVNTCSVTARADSECRQTIRRALRNPNPFVVVTGCYAQLQPEEVASIDGVDVVLGAKEKFNLFEHVTTFAKRPHPLVLVSDIDAVDEFGPAHSTTTGERTRAFLKVQDGCDFNCSFCTIPLARGASRSLGVGDCIEQASELVHQGYKEIVLTGVNVGDYGKASGTSLIRLLERLVEVKGLQRVRISSIEPNLLTREIIDFVADEEVMCKHFHVPLQSGNDEILRAMRRRYTAEMYRDLIFRIKGRMPECGIGVDVIVGFPGETDAQFGTTCSFLAGLPVSYLHVFTYSERLDTPAATYGGQIGPNVRFQRSETLRMLGLKKKDAFHASMVGRSLAVLMEEDVDGGMRFGFTTNYVRVGLPTEGTQKNSLVTAEILGVENGMCIGTIVEQARLTTELAGVGQARPTTELADVGHGVAA